MFGSWYHQEKQKEREDGFRVRDGSPGKGASTTWPGRRFLEAAMLAVRNSIPLR
jgi:hypothetical protein